METIGPLIGLAVCLSAGIAAGWYVNRILKNWPRR